MNYLTMLFDWVARRHRPMCLARSAPPKYDAWLADAANAAGLVDRMSRLVLGQTLAEPAARR
jgi:hypothetical protein